MTADPVLIFCEDCRRAVERRGTSQARCSACAAERKRVKQREYYAAHRDEYRAYERMRRERDRDTKAAYMREYCQRPEQRERHRARQRKANMTAQQIERHHARGRIENMTPQQIEQQRERGRNKTPEQRAQARDRALKRKYGPDFGAAAWDELWAEQGGLCAACQEPMTKAHERPDGQRHGAQSTDAHVDHEHRSGLRNRLLCQRCNTILGRAQNDPGVLIALARYAEEYHGDDFLELRLGA